VFASRHICRCRKRLERPQRGRAISPLVEEADGKSSAYLTMERGRLKSAGG